MFRQTASLLIGIVTLSGCAPLQGRTTEVVFAGGGDVELSGTLVFPKTAAEPVPAVVLLHGSEPATRSFAYRMHANIFIERGMAVLLYDKRGAGESAGDHESATYADLVEDALGAVRFLRSREGVDPARLGLVGASESGWFTPEIAERAGNIAFIINKVGPCDSWRVTTGWEAYNEFLDAGVDEVSATEQVAVRDRLLAYYIDPDPDERRELERILADWAQRKGSQLPPRPAEATPAEVQDIGYDPTPYIERGTTPVLYVYGSEDVNVPTAHCVERLTELSNAGKPVQFHVFEGAGHELGGIGLGGYRFVNGYKELLGDFAVEHAGRKR